MESLDVAELGKAFKQQTHRCKAVLECNIKDELIMKAHHASRCAVSLLSKHKNCEETGDGTKKADLLKKAMYHYSQSILDLTYFQECVQSKSDFADEASLDALSKIIHTLSLPAQVFKGSEEGLVAVLGIEVLECLYWRVGAVLYMYCYSLFNKEERKKNMDINKFLMCCCAGVGHLRLLLTVRKPLGKGEDYVANDTDMVDLMEKGIFSDIHMLSLMYSGDMCYWAWSLVSSSPMVTPISSPVVTPVTTPTSSVATPTQSLMVTPSVSYVSSMTMPTSSTLRGDFSAASSTTMSVSHVVLGDFSTESASRGDSSIGLSDLSAEFSSHDLKGDSSADFNSDHQIKSAMNRLKLEDAAPSSSFPTPPSSSSVSARSSTDSVPSNSYLDVSSEKVNQAPSKTDLTKNDAVGKDVDLTKRDISKDVLTKKNVVDLVNKDADLASKNADPANKSADSANKSANLSSKAAVVTDDSSLNFFTRSESPKTMDTDFLPKDISVDVVDLTLDTPTLEQSLDSVEVLSRKLRAADLKAKEPKTLQHFPLDLKPGSDVSDVSTSSMSSKDSTGSKSEASVFYVTRNSQLVEEKGVTPGSLDLYHVMRHTKGEEAVIHWQLDYEPLKDGVEMLSKYIAAARGPLKAHDWDYSRAVEIMVKLKKAAASGSI